MPVFNYVTNSGMIMPDTSQLKTEVQGEYVTAFGPALILADDSPQGRLIDVETTARDGVIRLAAEVANQFNPNYSSGIFLKAVCALHAVNSTAESNSILPSVECLGTPGTIIPSGSRIADEAGNFYASITQLTIGVGGIVTGDFQATVAGDLSPGTGTVTTIIDGTFGWTGVTNPNVTIVGSVSETDNELRQERNNQLSLLSKGPVEAISSNVSALDGVRSVSIRENDDDAAATIDGVVLSPHATWVCVQGGVDVDIGLALIKSKQTGSPYTSGTSNGTPVALSVTDPISGQSYPVLFTRPDEIAVMARFVVSPGSAINAVTAIPDAAVQYANGGIDGERGFVNGADVSAFELASAVNKLYPELFIKRVEVALKDVSPVWTTDPIVIELWQHATILASDVLVIEA